METDEVHAALQALQHAGELVGMAGGVVVAGEHGVFETDAPLAGEVVPADQLQHVADRVGLFHRHQREALGREGVMETDGEVAAGLVEVFLQVRKDADGAEGDALRAPGKAPVGGQDGNDPGDFLPVVERLAHAHEDRVRQAVGFFDGEVLREDLRGGQAAVETLAAGHAEAAAHLAAGLGGDAEGLAVPVRNHDRLDAVEPAFLCAREREEVFARAVPGGLDLQREGHSDLVLLPEPRPAFFGKVGHGVDVPDFFLVEPARNLPAGKAGKAAGKGDFLQLCGGLSKENGFHRLDGLIFYKNKQKNGSLHPKFLYLCQVCSKGTDKTTFL